MHGDTFRIQKEGIGAPQTGVADNCKMLCGCWKPNLCPLQEQEVLFTIGPLPSLLSLLCLFKYPLTDF